LNVGGVQIDHAAAAAFLEAVTPAALAASLVAAQSLEADHDAALAQWRLAVERTRYEAECAERRYRTVDPENRLVARGLEAEWEARLRERTAAEASSTAASRIARAPSVPCNGSASPRWARTCRPCGPRPPPRRAIGRSSCARCWRK